MSKAFKCDRCKKCFDPWKENTEFGTFREFVVRDGRALNNNEYTYIDEEIDLCPDCLKSFNNWFKSVNTGKVTTAEGCSGFSDIPNKTTIVDGLDDIRKEVKENVQKINQHLQDLLRKNSKAPNEKDGV